MIRMMMITESGRRSSAGKINHRRVSVDSYLVFEVWAGNAVYPLSDLTSVAEDGRKKCRRNWYTDINSRR